jgi:probable F420-dependent oxidoreductase
MTSFELPPIGLWAGALRTVPVREAQDIACEVESLGYGTIWFPESDNREVFVHLAMLLGATTSLSGGTSVANIWGRDALAMSCAAQTLTEAFPERFVLGLGISHQPLVEGMRGHIYERPLATMRAYLDALDAASYTGYPPATPVRRFLAALGPKMLELAAARTDGVLPYLAPVEHTARSRAAFPDGLVCPVQAIVFERDRATAHGIAREAHLRFYMGLPNYLNNLRRLGFTDADFADGGSDRLVDALVAWGDVDDIAGRVAEHFDAGASQVIAQVIGPTSPPREIWKEIAPALLEAGASRR